ncbi:MAG: hypothetical protein PVI86_12985 [Phycisphaerae bacterium]|jgi:hypothetical protein
MTSRKTWVVLFVMILAGLAGLWTQSGFAQTAEGDSGAEVEASAAAGAARAHPLASKEEMIRDRFARFEDRVYRLREMLDAQEPENASRLARVLERAGELGLAERLDELIDRLRDPALLDSAVEAQTEWVADADRLLAVLLEGDVDDTARRDEIERLQAYQKKISELLDQERGLRRAAGQAGARARMKAQLDQALKRVDGLQRAQEGLAEQTEAQSAAGAKSAEQLAPHQEGLERDASRLAEDLKRLSELGGDEPEDAEAMEAARAETEASSASVEKSASAMSKAGESLQRGDTSGAQSGQQEAAEALGEAKEQLERALEKLSEQSDVDRLAEEQQKLADETGGLADQMRNESESGGSQGQKGSQSKSKSPSPGQQSVEQAQREMDDASKSLGESNPQDATPKQDRAIEQLEEAQEELEEVLSQLRKEEREEILRDLEGRFRDMLLRQQAVNEGTLRLHRSGVENFGRAERLELAELSVSERDLAGDAETCLHILDEDGTTVVFPRVVGQISEDMATVADRLADGKVGALTQTIEDEIVRSLNEVLQAVKRMQQESQQSAGMPRGAGDDMQPLLPTSAELKLLRAGQVRVNERTVAIDKARQDASESPEALDGALRAVAARQAECGEMANEIRDRQQIP